jgi:hypothetical protein
MIVPYKVDKPYLTAIHDQKIFLLKKGFESSIDLKLFPTQNPIVKQTTILPEFLVQVLCQHKKIRSETICFAAYL